MMDFLGEIIKKSSGYFGKFAIFFLIIFKKQHQKKGI